MTKSYLYIVSALLFSFSMHSNGQSLRAYESAAAKASANHDYTAALGYYNIILEEAGDDKLENYYKAGEVARKSKDYQRAENYYAHVVNNRKGSEFADADYWLGISRKYLAKYTEAKAAFQSYTSRKSGGKKGMTEKAQKEIENATWAMKVIENADDAEIIHLDENVNSGYADFSPVVIDDELLFSSIRYFNGEIEGNKPFAKIMTSQEDAMAVTLKGNINLDLQHVSNPSISANGKRLYYTICDENETLERRCDIYYRDRDGEDWGTPVKLPESVNEKNANNSQPFEGIDTKGNKFLLFSSNRSSGKGGMDIYVSEIDANGNFGQAYNLEALNSEGNDVTPSYHSRTRTLYFSTDGYHSLGGLDIYKSRRMQSNWSEPVHAGFPLNSSHDDAYLRLNERGDAGYFSSSRPGSTCLDESLACDCADIYEVKRPIVDLIVRTYNAITKEPLKGTEVQLIPRSYDSESQMDLDNNEYYFGIDFENGYDIKGMKDGYSEDVADAETFGTRNSTTLERDLFLTPMVDLSTLVFDKRTGEPLTGATVILEILDETGEVVKQFEVDKNNFEFPLDWMKSYRVTASKEGYIEDMVEVTTDGIPVVPTNLSENLFLCRKPFANYPFLAMYFDNDFPKIAGPDLGISPQDYATTYRNYSNEEKRQEFLASFNKPEEKQEILDFFSTVDEGYTRLERFAANLETLLVKESVKDTVVVTMKGYASPRSTPVYNDHLTERRINSMEQFLALYNEGTLKPALTDGRIKIVREPYGEAKAQGGSEDFNNRKASVYAVDASKERRVEIIRITTNKFICPENDTKF